jgi:hypothetical protein
MKGSLPILVTGTHVLDQVIFFSQVPCCGVNNYVQPVQVLGEGS